MQVNAGDEAGRGSALRLLLLRPSEPSLRCARSFEACSILQAAQAWLFYQNSLVSLPCLARVSFAPWLQQLGKELRGRRLGKVENCEEWKRQGKQRMKKEVWESQGQGRGVGQK